MRVVHVVGARPNFMKVGPVIRAMDRSTAPIEQLLVHTGQHYDSEMSEVFFTELGLPMPDIDLGIGSGSHAEQTGRVMLGLEPILAAEAPDWVLVYGDVNSTLAGALTAAKLGLGTAHVEAGLRSFDRNMPEEYNRVLTDHVADALFTPSRDANENLAREGIPEDRVHFVGNVMIDTLVRLLPHAERRAVLEDLGLVRDGRIGDYVLVTLHRPSNVDDPHRLGQLAQGLQILAESVPVVFPIHPRTRARLGWSDEAPSGRPTGVRLLPPLGYLDFLALERHAAGVLTDSGGVQEETSYLGVPCFTVRENTERPITIEHGTNRLIGPEPGELVASVLDRIEERAGGTGRSPPELWDGRAAERIVAALAGVPPARVATDCAPAQPPAAFPNDSA